MKSHGTSSGFQSNEPFNPAFDFSIAQLVGKVYDDAPAIVRKRMLASLLRPLGVLSVFGVANGIFAKIMFRKGLHNGHDRLQEIKDVAISDVIALVEYVEQLRPDSLDGLCQMLMACPDSAGRSVEALVRRIQYRQTSAAEGPVLPSRSPDMAHAAHFREDDVRLPNP